LTTNRINNFNHLLSEIDTRLAAVRGSTVEAAADGYELAGAIDLLKRFLISGNYQNLDEGINRLTRVFERRGRADREWGKSSLARLRTLGEEMTKLDRDVALEGDGASLNLPQGATTSLVDATGCDVLIIAAMYEPELSTFLRRLSDVEQLVGGTDSLLPDLTYYRGKLKRSQEGSIAARSLSVVAVFQDRTGMVDCSILVTAAARFFRPALVAMTGVCAGRGKAGVRLCDLVVPSQIFTYDTGKYTEGGFQPEPLWVETAEGICRRIIATGESILEQLSREIQAAYEGNVYVPKIHTQVMACGSAVVDREDIFESIGDANRKVVGLDMESYAVLRALKLYSPRTPAFVVKSVMDLGRKKRDRVKSQAAFWAASFLARFIAQEFESIQRKPIPVAQVPIDPEQ